MPESEKNVIDSNDSELEIERIKDSDADLGYAEDEEEVMYRITKNAGPPLTGEEPEEELVHGRRKGITKLDKQDASLEKAIRIVRRLSSGGIGGPSPLDDAEEQEAEDREVQRLRSELRGLRSEQY